MDEAYRCVKRISSVAVWENMAQMCVKTKRLDVAEVCLGNMGNARGAKAVRLAKAREPERDAHVAMVAIQLGLIEDAERLYVECGRYDLLVQLYVSTGRWAEALAVCATKDRIHLKSVHYLYARHLEAAGDQAAAIKQYEASDTHKHEVPRMLFDASHITDLEAYIKASADPALYKWWAQYCESNGQYDDAILYYNKAKEQLALVRVFWYRGEDGKAADLCRYVCGLALALAATCACMWLCCAVLYCAVLCCAVASVN
jgi:intraflagellar transport protein 140